MRSRLETLLLLAGALVATGCGGEDAKGSTSGSGGGGGEGAGGGAGEHPCPPGELAVDGGCLPAGLPPDWMDPRALPEPAAGVPSDACGDGFTSDGLGGCQAILPATPCTGATMAVPGDTSCHPVAECGTGTWGDIPVDASTIHVDQSFAGPPDGSAGAPYPTVQAAVDAAPAAATVAIAAGSYVEDVAVVDKAVTIWGRCPALVSIVGVDATAAVALDQAGGSVVKGLAVTGPKGGVLAIDSSGAVLDQLHVHQTTTFGVGAAANVDDAVELRDSLVEDAGITGVVSQGMLRVVDSEVRGVPGGEMLGIGCWLADHGGLALRVEGSYVHHATAVGIDAESTMIEVSRTLIADVQPDASGWGSGLLATSAGREPATVQVDASVIARSTAVGVAADGSAVSLDAVTIEQTNPDDAGFGLSLRIAGDVVDPPGAVTATRSVFRDSTRIGIELAHGSFAGDRLLVQRVAPDPLTGEHSRAIDVGPTDGSLGPSDLLLEESIVEGSHRDGITLFGSNAILRDSIVRDVSLLGAVPIAFGVTLTDATTPTQPSTAVLERCRVEGVEGFGLYVQGSRLELRDSVSTAHLTLPIDGISGVGVATESGVEDARAELVVDGSAIVDNGGRGITAAYTDATVTNTLVAGTTANPSDWGGGRGVAWQYSTASMRGVEIGDVASAGIEVSAADVTLEAVYVHDVDLSSSGSDGYGVATNTAPPTVPNLVARGCRIERTATAGILVDEATFDLADTLVGDIEADAFGRFGRGVVIQESTGSLDHLRVERARDAGISLLESPSIVADTTILDILAGTDGLLGDGLMVVSTPDAEIRGSRIDNVARAALSVFASEVVLGDNDLTCNDLPLASETHLEVPSVLHDDGGNQCGCGEAPQPCKAVSAGLTPPEALPGNEPGM